MNELETMLKRIKNLCKEKKVTYKELSKMSGISVSTLSKIMSKVIKEPSIITVIKIAHALGVTADFLVYGEENPDPNTVTISENEAYLLNTFRSLSDQGQEYILQTIEMVKDKYKKDICSADLQKIS